MKQKPPTEYQEQVAVLDWWVLYAKMKGLDERLLFASANAAKRSYKLAGMLKRSGMRPGLPDLMLASPKWREVTGKEGELWMCTLFTGMFIEMKRKGAKAEPHQLDYCELLRSQGYNVVIAQGSEEAIRAIKGYLG